MMYADLVDMTDFIAEIELVGVKCSSNDCESVKISIDKWLSEVDTHQSNLFWDVITRIADDGILLPDVEDVIDWSYARYH